MILETCAVPPFLKNGFVVGCEDTGKGVLIDPGDEVEDLLAAARRHGLTLEAVLLTHAHVDHVSGVARVRSELDAPVYLHSADQFLYDNAVHMGRLFGLEIEAPPPVDRYYDQGHEALAFGTCQVRVHHTPGHCPGGVCLQIGPRGEPGPFLFVGDTLFAGSIGRTDLPGGDMDTLLRSIRQVLLPLGDEKQVLPGHGEPTTIGVERRTNPFLNDEVSFR